MQSSFSADTHAVAATLISTFRRPPEVITIYQLAQTYKQKHALPPADWQHLDQMREFVMDTNRFLLGNLQLDFQRTQMAEIGHVCWQTFSEIPLQYRLEETPNTRQVTAWLRALYTNIARLSDLRDELQRLLPVYSAAEGYLEAYDKGLYAYCVDFGVCATIMRSGLAERQRFNAIVNVDIKSTITLVGEMRRQLTAHLNSAAGRLEILLRLESSLRLLTQYAGQDFTADRFQSRAATTPLPEAYADALATAPATTEAPDADYTAGFSIVDDSD